MTAKGKRVSEIGEFALIDRIRKFLPEQKHPDMLIGPGDDTAVIKIGEDRALLATCDIQIEDRHFRRNYLSAYQLGRRSVAVNLSDIAAMGGQPTFALLSLGLPKDFPVADYDDLMKGVTEELQKYSAFLIGGNLAQSEKKLIIDITLLGEMPVGDVLTRSGAGIGDRIFVTGNLGAAGAGFCFLEKYGKDFPVKFETLVNKHLQPQARVNVGRQLAGSGIITSMIDLSDGLASDLNHICRMSQVGAEIDAARIPFPAEIREAADFCEKKPINLALHSGEDYELLFTLKTGADQAVLKEISEKTSVQIAEIGRIVPPEKGFYLVNENGSTKKIQPSGWDHFGSSKTDGGSD